MTNRREVITLLANLFALDERYPIPAARTKSLPDHELVAGVHGAHVDLLVGKDDDDPVFHIDDHLLLAVYRFVRELFELLKKRLAAPGRGVAWIDMQGDEI